MVSMNITYMQYTYIYAYKTPIHIKVNTCILLKTNLLQRSNLALIEDAGSSPQPREETWPTLQSLSGVSMTSLEMDLVHTLGKENLN